MISLTLSRPFQYLKNPKSMVITPAASDASLFIYKDRDSVTYLLLYIDDIILTASYSDILCHIIVRLSLEFMMTDLRALHHFLGISVTHSSN